MIFHRREGFYTSREATAEDYVSFSLSSKTNSPKADEAVGVIPSVAY